MEVREQAHAAFLKVQRYIRKDSDAVGRGWSSKPTAHNSALMIFRYSIPCCCQILQVTDQVVNHRGRGHRQDAPPATADR